MKQKNYVPSQEVAFSLAEVYISSIYGSDISEQQKPYLATDEGDSWKVKGQMKEMIPGGTFEIKLAKLDGRVISIFHGK